MNCTPSIANGISRSPGISGIARRPSRGSPRRSAATAPGIVQENAALLKTLNEQIRGLDQELKGLAQHDPQARRLMTHPGAGAETAVAVRAWIGDIHRFASAKHLVSYCGLAPRVRL